MSEWKLKDCCISISDGDHLPPPKADDGIPFITISNINSSNQIDFQNTLFVPREYYENLDKIRKPIINDILYSVVGSFGKAVLVKNFKEFVFQRHIAILRPNPDVVIPSYLYYVMSSKQFYYKADTVAIGAAQRTISLTSLRNMIVNLPPIKTQHNIAEILSRYDSLIENYQKQIKLLEESAQRLYKEWFVDLRFPGHENTKIVDGVPEGWSKGIVSDIVSFFDSKRKPLSSMQRINMDKIYPYYGAASIMDYVDNYLFDGVYVLLGEDGTVITKDGYPILQYVWGKFWVNNHAHVLQGKNKVTTEYIYMMFKNTHIANLVTGCAQPKISQGRLSCKEILIPSNFYLSMWDNITKKIFNQIRFLYNQTTKLTEARDRLLPKLMSGEIEV